MPLFSGSSFSCISAWAVLNLSCSLGFKLALGWREQQQEGELPPYDGDLFPFLLRSGLDYLEFSVGACRDQREISLLRQEASACASAGLGVSFHPYLGPPHNPALFGEGPQPLAALDAVLAAASMASEVTGGLTRLVVHPAEMSHGSAHADPAALRRTLIARSQAFFAAAEERLARLPQVRVVVEHQVPPAPGETVIRIGDTYAELLEAVRGTSLGLCWDTGHYLLSVRRHGQSATPPDEFLRRVEAVHLHDVVEGNDHQVISRRSSRLRDYVHILVARGFSGGITLEYSAHAIRAAGSFERVVADSLSALSSWAP
jgi:sugar phosphate isomerase/epimerase